MKVLITGANGFVGYYVTKLLLEKGYQVIATGRGDCRLPFSKEHLFSYYQMDFTDADSVKLVFEKTEPDAVIHSGAVSKPDECELNKEKAWNINVQGTINLLREAENLKSFFLFVSTDFVFDGEKGMYTEEDDCQPVNFYGFTKMQAEGITETSSIPYTIVRTCLVYGVPLQGKRSNIFTWVKNSLESGQPIKVVDDQWRTPTSVEDLAEGIELIIQQGATGVYHISGEEGMSPYGFACRVADHFGLNKQLIEKVTAQTFSQPGRRPPQTGFIIDKAKKDLGFSPRSLEKGFS